MLTEMKTLTETLSNPSEMKEYISESALVKYIHEKYMELKSAYPEQYEAASQIYTKIVQELEKDTTRYFSYLKGCESFRKVSQFLAKVNFLLNNDKNQCILIEALI